MLIMSYTLGQGGQRRIRTYSDVSTIREYLVSVIADCMKREQPPGGPSLSLTVENASWEEWHLGQILSGENFFPDIAYALSAIHEWAIRVTDGTRHGERWYAPADAPKGAQWLWERLSESWHDLTVIEHAEEHSA